MMMVINVENIIYLIPFFVIATCILLYVAYSNKRKYLIYVSVLIISVCLFLIFGKGTFLLLLNPVVLGGLIRLIHPIFLKLYIKIRNKYIGITSYKDLDTLNREIKFDYNPSIIGYAMNQKLELRDLSADIMNLYAKRILKIEKDENLKYKIEYGENYNKYEKDLSYGDKYILFKLLENENEFEFMEWEAIIEAEYDNLELSKKRIYMSDKKFFITNGLIIVILLVLSKILGFTILQGFVTCVLGPFVFTFFYVIMLNSKDNKRLKFTAKGKNEMKKYIKLKKFMQEYTLLEERTMEEIQIYEKYIPYAIALGVNNKYFTTVSDIFGEDIQNIIVYIDTTKYYGRIDLNKNYDIN